MIQGLSVGFYSRIAYLGANPHVRLALDTRVQMKVAGTVIKRVLAYDKSHSYDAYIRGTHVRSSRFRPPIKTRHFSQTKENINFVNTLESN